ncbi:hypothetical protein ABT297_20830 [Dactylosporangium sp. NPDC000555]|uniref:hypothetical protein n=1 Tax=Dactylosporangium sp. NPDC000555 TaxID=3154260 RepID=UPI00332F60A3
MPRDAEDRRLEPFEWNSEESVRYEVAIEVIGEGVAHYSALLNAAEAAGDEPEAARLRAEIGACVEERYRLRATDHEGVTQVLHKYRALLRAPGDHDA